YFKYEAKKERQSWRNVRSKSSPTRYEGEDFNSSHRDESITLDFPHYYEDAFVDKYYALPPLLPCFRTSQPHNERSYESPNTRNEVDIDSMTIAEFNLYIARQMKNPLNNPSYGAENLRRMGQDKVRNGCDNNTSRDMNHESGNLLNFPIFPLLMNFLEFDITVEDVELIRQFLTPNVNDEIDEVIQPLILQPIHTTPPNDDYVSPATKSILDELLEEFGDEILNVTMVDEEAKFNPTKDIKELERLLAKDPQSYFTEIQLYRSGRVRPGGKGGKGREGREREGREEMREEGE
ncbi:hypothetical protein Tco_0222314, partial [Tanacetum coccineum]